jgi:hypothetical protein
VRSTAERQKAGSVTSPGTKQCLTPGTLDRFTGLLGVGLLLRKKHDRDVRTLARVQRRDGPPRTDVGDVGWSDVGKGQA